MIRRYRASDETSWCRCRVLSFLQTSYYDDVLQSKASYEGPSLELVYEVDGLVAGLLDVEWEERPGQLCRGRPDRGAVIWNLAVHPDHQRRQIATLLLEEALAELSTHQLAFIDAWTRDDACANGWYQRNRFELVESYLHAYFSSTDARRLFSPDISGVVPVQVFAHLVGEDGAALAPFARRCYPCRLYRRLLAS